MTEMYDNDLYRSKQVIEMLTVAHEYCLFLEKADDFSEEAILDYLLKISPLLYLKGTLLPGVAVFEPDANERFVTLEQWEGIFVSLRNKLGKKDEFIILPPAFQTGDAAEPASISDHFADVYQDMKDFVILYQKNTKAAQENASSEIRRLFETHWGPRLLDALHHLHQLHYSPKGQFDEDLPGIV